LSPSQVQKCPPPLRNLSQKMPMLTILHYFEQTRPLRSLSTTLTASTESRKKRAEPAEKQEEPTKNKKNPRCNNHQRRPRNTAVVHSSVEYKIASERGRDFFWHKRRKPWRAKTGIGNKGGPNQPAQNRGRHRPGSLSLSLSLSSARTIKTQETRDQTRRPDERTLQLRSLFRPRESEGKPCTHGTRAGANLGHSRQKRDAGSGVSDKREERNSKMTDGEGRGPARRVPTATV